MTDPAAALERLDEVTRRLRKECPWDREQDERTIVPHTVEEAYELADAVNDGDDAKLLDELGDVLFQVLFLSLLMEERGAGNLAQVADGCREKLIRRHPHVFGDETVESAIGVIRNWDTIKAESEGGGSFGDLPETLPALLYATKVSRRAERAGRDPAGPQDVKAEEIGERLFELVEAARAMEVDPELALREHARKVRAEVEARL